MKWRSVVLGLAVAAAVGMAGRVQGAELQVLFDGKSAGLWQTQRDEARLHQELALSELRADRAEGSLVWRFESKGPAFNDIFLARPISRRFTAIRVLVRNAGAPVTLAAKLGDADRAEWSAQRAPLPANSGWQWVDFPSSQWKVASWSRDADGRLDLPTAYLALIAFDVKPGVVYDLRIRRIEVVHPDRGQARVDAIDLPGTMVHGRSYPASLSVRLSGPAPEGPWRVAFVRSGATQFEAPVVAGQGPRRTARVEVPEFAWGGAYSVDVRIGDARTVWRTRRPVVRIVAREARKSMARVQMHNGTPTLFIDGQPRSGMAYAAYSPSVEVFRDFARAGVDLYTFSGTPTEAGYGLSRTVWTAPGRYDYSELDQRIQMVLQANPNAYFFPRLYLHAPKWWSDRHPDDLVQYDPGDGHPRLFLHNGEKPAPSWASEAWRRDTIEGLKRLIAHIEAAPYADRCIGYHIASGTTEEWMMWGSNEDEWVDYSPANVAGFRRWLRARYGSDAALQAAWHDPHASLDHAAVPTRAERAASTFGALRDPASEQRPIDYVRYTSDLVADTICTFARAIKQATGGKKIVGAFYGYILQLCGEQRQQNAGHHALGTVLQCSDIDFLCSPTSYAFRQIGGEGTSHFMSLLGSVQAHGKLWFNENDVRTSLSGGQTGEWGRPANVAGDLLQQDKELANAIVNGAAQWWFDVGGNRYNDPALMRRIGELTARANEALKLDRAPVDEIAFVTDEAGLAWLRVGDPLGAWLQVSQLPALRRIGAPVGDYLATDLPRLHDRKLFIFPTSFAPTDADRRAIDALKRDNHVLVFLYAPGLYRDGRIDEAGMEALTGIRLRLSRDPQALRVTLTGASPLVAGLAGQPMGYERRTFPIVWADDPASETLGALDDGRAGFVVKRFPGWTAVFCAAPAIDQRVWVRLAELAGVHRYIDTPDVVWARRELIGVSVNDPGPRTITLRAPAAVRDLWTGELLATDARQFTADFADRATRVFVIR